jgi:site-specific recombinase XerD
MHRKPSRMGAAVIARKAKNGATTFSIKYRDSAGEQAWERLGTDSEGWTRAKARAVLEERLTDVRREGLRRPSNVTVASVAGDWLAVYPSAKGLKRSTTAGYAGIVNNYVVPLLGHLRIDELDVAVLDRYVADRLAAGAAPASVNRELNVLSLIVRNARKRRLLRENPVELVDRPRERRRRWRILTPTEVGRVRTAFELLMREATEEEEGAFIAQARVAFAVVYGLGLRRGELLGLRWRHVRLADPEGPTLRVEETFVRNRVETPKSAASTRTVAIGRVLANVLFEHRARSAYDADDDRVFCNVSTGGPLDHKRYADTFRSALRRAGIEDEVRPFHDGRHTSITNAAAAGVAPAALQARAGHSDLSTTQRYIDLAGVLFRDEAEAAEARMFGVQAEKLR